MTSWPASFKSSMVFSCRKPASETSLPASEPKFQTLLAHCSNSRSCVTPRSMVMGSYLVRAGVFRFRLGSPPSRCSTTSVVFFNPETLLTPATYLLSHFTRNLKFLYGSKRLALTVKLAIKPHSSRLDLPGQLLDLDDHELGRFKRGEPDQDVDDAGVDVVLSCGVG